MSRVTLNFDDLRDPEDEFQHTVPPNYGSLQWENFAATWFGMAGYGTGTISGDSVAYNPSGNPARISGAPFTFESGYFTAAWIDGLRLEIAAFNNARLVNITTLTLNTLGPTFIQPRWEGIDALRFVSFSAGGITDRGQFVLDDFTFSQAPSAPVPEPTTMLLLGTGFAGIATRRWWQAGRTGTSTPSTPRADRSEFPLCSRRSGRRPHSPAG